MIRRYEVEVIRTQNVIVEIDDSSFDKQAIQEYVKSFHPYETYERHAEQLAWYAVEFDSPAFIEGYGYVRYDGKTGYDYQSNKYPDPTYEINIKMVGRSDVDTNAEELK